MGHRGGRKGFVRVDNDGALTIPDFPGNRYFNTLGNIVVTGRAGVVVPAFETGDLLLLTGDASVGMTARDQREVALMQGAERLWRLSPHRGWWLRGALPLAFQFQSWSPQTLATGVWPLA